MRSEGYCSCVCLSVKSHLTSVCPENAVTYSVGNEGEKIMGFSLNPLWCRDLSLLALYGYPSSAYAVKRTCAITHTPLALWGHAFSWRHGPASLVQMHVCVPRLVLFISPSAVTVHMEQVTYEVEENVGSVEVCAVIRSPPGVECPVDFSVSVTISTSDDTARTYLYNYKLHVCVCTLMHFYSHSLYLWLVNSCHTMHSNTTVSCLYRLRSIVLWYQNFTK